MPLGTEDAPLWKHTWTEVARGPLRVGSADAPKIANVLWPRAQFAVVVEEVSYLYAIVLPVHYEMNVVPKWVVLATFGVIHPGFSAPDLLLRNLPRKSYKSEVVTRNQTTIRELQTHRKDIASLPDMGVPGSLKSDLADELTQVKDRLAQSDFYSHAADLNTTLTGIKARVRDAATAMATGQKQAIKDAQQDLQRLPEWPELTQEEQGTVLGELDGLSAEATTDLAGLKTLLNQDFMISTKTGELKRRIETLGRKRKLERIEEEKAKAKKAGQTKLTRTVSVPGVVKSAADLDGIITQLHGIKDELALYSEIDVTIQVKG